MEGKLFLGQYLIWVILLFGQLYGCKSCIEKERKALVELKKHIVDSDLDYVLPTWNNDTKGECCEWEGIMCNRTSGRVIGISFGGYTYSKESSLLNLSLLHPFEEVQSLDLSGGQFNGFVDDVEGYKSLRRLRNLETLDLSFNKFNNSILPFLNAATSLTALDLSSNAFSSTMELQVVCRMKNLRELDLSGNRFVGQLPLCLGSLKKLRVLDFSSNQLSGNLPSSFNSLESLEYLSLSDNNFTSLFSLDPLANLTKLKVFKLSSSDHMLQVETESNLEPKFQLSVVVLRVCNLEKIPFFLMYQKNLRLVDLSSNRLSGNIPTWLLENNPKLEVLYLQDNAFTHFQMPTIVHNLKFFDISANDISGLFPDNIGHALPTLIRMNGSRNGFQGHFPSSMGEMVNITHLDLSYNSFSGELPRSFVTGCFSLKHLKLSHNKLGGDFLPRGTSFSSLKELRMDSNLFTGKIGVGLLSSNTTLSVLDMSKNRLTGAIPSWISNLSSLSTLLISNNFLEGTIPPTLSAMRFLSFLDLSGNLLAGAIPSHVGGEFNKQLFLHDNNFTGPIPDTLLEGVQVLDVRNNKLSGSIPQFVNTQSIYILLLRGNNLTGSIPRKLCDLRRIKLLDLSDNKLNGFIPSCLYNLSFGRGGDEDGVIGTAYSATMELEFYKSTFVAERLVIESEPFEEIEIKFATKQRYDSYFGASQQNMNQGILYYMYGMDLSSNELSGVIPAELGDLSKLRVMNLSHNFLSSSIPSSFSNLTDIESLDLSHNMLHGSIPYQVTSLTSLAVFDVSYNNLSGIIPQGKQFNTFDGNSYLGNPLLCGPPTDRICGAKKSSEEAYNGGEEKEDDGAAIDMVIFYYSTASTYVTALIVILALMCFDCPWRRAWLRIVDAFIAASAKRMLP